ncbi:MAG: TIGR00295 family protein [Methanobrevibacter sp.]|nr:TIGR00295 family protein [Methanobrevibacter sp.]
MEIEILKKEKTPPNVIDHSVAVCKKAFEIAQNFPQANLELIEKGALLHDIGRSRTHGIRHAIVGVEIAREYGYSEDVLNIIERHIGAGITKEEAKNLGLFEKSYVPQSLEEKIVAHADNLISGTKEVDIDFVIEKWKSRMENPDDNIKRLIKLDEELIQAFKG